MSENTFPILLLAIAIIVIVARIIDNFIGM